MAGTFSLKNQPSIAFSGRVDRLAVHVEVLYVADFKIGRPPRAEPPREYVKQLALYRAALTQIYPDRDIRAYLVWIEAGVATRLTSEQLDEALAMWS